MSLLGSYSKASESEILSDADARLQGESERYKDSRRFWAGGQLVWRIRRKESIRGRKDFMAPGKRGGFLENGGDRTVFLLAELNGVFHGGFVQRSAKAIENFQFFPDGGRLGGAFAGADDFQRFKFLAFFLQDADYIRGRARAESHQDKLHRSRGFVGSAVGIDGDGVAGRAGGHELFFANPLYGCCLHLASLRNYSAFPE